MKTAREEKIELKYLIEKRNEAFKFVDGTIKGEKSFSKRFTMKMRNRLFDLSTKYPTYSADLLA